MERIRKVLMLVENAPVPTDQRVWNEATALRDHGFQVMIISPKGDRQCREAYVCLDGIYLYRYDLPIMGSGFSAYVQEYCISLLKAFCLSLKVWFRHGFDVIHAANPPDTFFIIGLFYRLFQKKFVFDLHDLAPEIFKVKFMNRMKLVYKLQYFLEWCSCRTAHLVIVTNASQKRTLVERNKCLANKVFVVRNGPDLRRIRRVSSEPELKRGRPYLLAYVGVMEVQDGVEYAIRVLHELVHQRGRQDVSLVLMGDGGHMSVLKELTHQLQMDQYVHFTGWVSADEMVRYLSVADVALSPDPQNGLNEHCTMVKTMEYMAMGRPVVAFDLAETRVSAQAAALYAIPNSVEDFASKVEILLDDQELRMQMSLIGRKRIEEELSWDKVKKNLLLAYETLFSIENKHLVYQSLRQNDEEQLGNTTSRLAKPKNV